ncbi:MAG: peptide-methionine (S)-S-oxide reductase [Parcubacteria group bacterium SW_4_46_8]|nr:MAG: peptide-methionine (S)-S-oxide reductase [Parcubacteria group bacterium SW_4_46_8]
MEDSNNTDVAYFAAGCFWGVEAHFRQLDGVVETAVGFMGGDVDDPTYKQVCSEDTGHAETTKVVFDPDIISYDTLLEHFWEIHDPTQLNRQGPDVGTQYRSAIFYDTDTQKMKAQDSKEAHQQAYTDEIVTEIVPADTFYKAAKHHQQYYSKR